MDNITRTIYGSALQTYLFLGKPVRYIDNTTLNERFDVLKDTLPNVNSLPKMQYFSIGNGGHKVILGQDGISINNPVIHQATDAALFNHLPFALRDPLADLDPIDRQKYGLRKQVIIQGKSYIAYYLKRIDNIADEVAMEIRTVDGDTQQVEQFIPDQSNLFPKPVDLSPDNINVLTGQYATASSKLNLSFSRREIDELRNVAKIMYGSEMYAIISEVAMVSGVDHSINVQNANGGMFSFNEVIGAQVVAFVNVYYQMVYSNDALEITIDAGAQEPLFKTNLLVTP